MNRLCIATSGIESWRQRSAYANSEWKRRSAAFETAISWELASGQSSGLPAPIQELFVKPLIGQAKLLVAIAGHKVPLVGHEMESRPNVWAIVSTELGMYSMTVQSTGRGSILSSESLSKWLERGYGESGKAKRLARWEHIRSLLPLLQADVGGVPFKLLQCCAASVIEAKRLGLTNAAFVVQAFKASEHQFAGFKLFCQAIGVSPTKGALLSGGPAAGINLVVGWADCPFATEVQIAATVR